MKRALDAPVGVMLFLPDLDGGGAQRTFVNLANALPPDRIGRILVTGRANGPARAWLDPTVRLVDLGCGRMRAALAPLRRLVRARRPAVLFSTMVDANILSAAATVGLSRRPAVVLRETNSHRSRDDLGALRRRAIRWAYRRADMVVALSTGVGRELVEDYGLDPAKVVTIPNPIDVGQWRAGADAARSRRPPWGEWAQGAPVLIGVGRLSRQKGFDLLLQALARLDASAARLVLLGEGPERGVLERLAAELGLSQRVLMPGFVDDPVAWLAHADLFVLSSRWEGFGHAIVEAMACGTPVVSTDCPYGPADILQNGETALLVPPENPALLAQAIDRMVEDRELSDRLALAASATAERFSSVRIARLYADLLVEAAAPSRETSRSSRHLSP